MSVISNPKHIAHVQRFARLMALKLEAKGMSRSRRPSMRQICANELGLKGRPTTQTVLEKYETYVEENRPKPVR